MIRSDPLQVVARLAQAFEDLEIPYLVGGSLASSLYGIPRATQDIDFVADIRTFHVEPLTGALTGEFYVDADMIRDAIMHSASFNLIHLRSMFKVDVFILKEDDWFHQEMGRARLEQVEIDEDTVSIRFASPEDMVLQKLAWYRSGNEVSERQWGDVLGVLKVQGGSLDQDYLDKWAPRLNIGDLLARARRQR